MCSETKPSAQNKQAVVRTIRWYIKDEVSPAVFQSLGKPEMVSAVGIGLQYGKMSFGVGSATLFLTLSSPILKMKRLQR